MAQSEARTFSSVDLFVLISHLGIGSMAAFGVEFLKFLPLYLRVCIGMFYLAAAWLIYTKVRQKQKRAEIHEIENWRRYQILGSHMLGIIGGFVKDRYKVNHDLATRIENQCDTQTLTGESFQNLLNEFDKERRVHIKSALTKLSSFLPEDQYKEPIEADKVVQDCFKVSFYAVEKDPTDKELYLVPKYRYYPNEGEPRTKRFKMGEGASGLAWQDKTVIVCERGGEDERFRDMWPGGGQKAHYASMICIPAIKDMPGEKISDVYGVLTIDTPIRREYFDKRMLQFWGELLNPITDLLIYCNELERVTKDVNRATEILARRDPPLNTNS